MTIIATVIIVTAIKAEMERGTSSQEWLASWDAGCGVTPEGSTRLTTVPCLVLRPHYWSNPWRRAGRSHAGVDTLCS